MQTWWNANVPDQEEASEVGVLRPLDTGIVLAAEPGWQRESASSPRITASYQQVPAGLFADFKLPLYSSVQQYINMCLRISMYTSSKTNTHLGGHPIKMQVPWLRI